MRPPVPANDSTPVVPERPLYCHFLSGELRIVIPTATLVKAASLALRVLALGTAVPLYCPYSAIWETRALNPDTLAFVRLLILSDILETIGYTDTIEEFLDTRQTLYGYDQFRYPAYFDPQQSALLSSLPLTSRKTTATTELLIGDLRLWAEGGDTELAPRHPAIMYLDRLLSPAVVTALDRREDEAVTFSLFAPLLEQSGLPPTAHSRLRDHIYLQYTSRYMGHEWGDIATGVFRVDYYDAVLTQDFPLHDVRLLSWLLLVVGFGTIVSSGWKRHRKAWETLGAYRGWGAQRRLASSLRLLLAFAYEQIPTKDTALPPNAARTQIREYLARFTEPWSDLSQLTMTNALEEGALRADRILMRVRDDIGMVLPLRFSTDMVDRQKADVLLMTATSVETTAVLAAFDITNSGEQRRIHVGDYTYFDLGEVAGARVVLVQCEAGSVGPYSSQLVAADSIQVWRPSSIIMVGIAFGVDKSRQQVGDLLVSKQIADYELARIGTSTSGGQSIVIRGDRPQASGRLLQRIRAALPDWDGNKVNIGLMLSGDKLVDNVDYRNDIVRSTGGEAIGGEMEGRGLYSSAHSRKVDWIVVKAVADWADGSKRARGRAQRQQIAASSAAKFIRSVLVFGGFRSR
jgi:nucleoside phosphorylase